MARIEEGVLQNFTNGMTMTADDYERDRETLRTSINDIEDKLVFLNPQQIEDLNNNVNQGVKAVQEAAVETVEARAGYPTLKERLAELTDIATNVKSFGAKGDGVTDDSASIQNAVNTGKSKIYVPSGTYMINGQYNNGEAVTNFGGIQLKSNQTLILAPDAVLKVIPSSNQNYSIVRINNCTNTKVFGGTIEGDRATNTQAPAWQANTAYTVDQQVNANGYILKCTTAGTSGSTSPVGTGSSITDGTVVWSYVYAGESGMGVYASNSDNIEIRTTVKNTWGDGVYINKVTDSEIYPVIDNCRRNGISVINAENVDIIEPVITNIKGTDPQNGIDIEPNYSTDILRNINIIGGRIADFGAIGIQANLNVKTTPDVIKIKIKGTSFEHSSGTLNNHAISVDKAFKHLSGSIDIIETKSKGLRHFMLRNNEYEGMAFRVVRPYAEDWNPTGLTGDYSSAFMVFDDVNNDPSSDSIGNVLIQDPVLNLVSQTADYGICVMDVRPTPKAVKNVKIIRPNFIGTAPSVSPLDIKVGPLLWNDIYIDNSQRDKFNSAVTDYQNAYYVPNATNVNLTFINGASMPSSAQRMELWVEAYMTGTSSQTGAIALFRCIAGTWSLLKIYTDSTNPTFNPVFSLNGGLPAVSHGQSSGKTIVVKHTVATAYSISNSALTGAPSLLTGKAQSYWNTLSGVSGSRSYYFTGQRYFDTTLAGGNSKPIWWNNTQWISADSVRPENTGVNAAVSASATNIKITLPSQEPNNSYGVLVSPAWNTNYWITSKTVSDFIINFGTAPSSASTLDWFIKR